MSADPDAWLRPGVVNAGSRCADMEDACFGVEPPPVGGRPLTVGAL